MLRSNKPQETKAMLKFFFIFIFLGACAQPHGHNHRKVVTDADPTTEPSTQDPHLNTPGDGAAPDTPDAPTASATPSPSPTPIDPRALRFSSTVQPILEKHCAECHHKGKSLDLTTFPFPGRESTAVAHKILLYTSGDTPRMPPRPRKGLSAGDIKTIEQWQRDGMIP